MLNAYAVPRFGVHKTISIPVAQDSEHLAQKPVTAPVTVKKATTGAQQRVEHDQIERIRSARHEPTTARRRPRPKTTTKSQHNHHAQDHRTGHPLPEPDRRLHRRCAGSLI